MSARGQGDRAASAVDELWRDDDCDDGKPADQHVTPLFGRRHDAAQTCWCRPDCVADYRATGGARVWVHHPEQ